MNDTRIERLNQGFTIVANNSADQSLIAKCFNRGQVVYIGRGNARYKLAPSKWRNPFIVGKHGDRDQVCDKFAEHLSDNPELLAALPELKGKVLVCWCYPERCHGDHLASMVNDATINH